MITLILVLRCNFASLVSLRRRLLPKAVLPCLQEHFIHELLVLVQDFLLGRLICLLDVTFDLFIYHSESGRWVVLVHVGYLALIGAELLQGLLHDLVDA